MSEASRSRRIRIAARGMVVTICAGGVGAWLALSEPAETMAVGLAMAALVIILAWIATALYEAAVWAVAAAMTRVIARIPDRRESAGPRSVYTPLRALLVLGAYFGGSGITALLFATAAVAVTDLTGAAGWEERHLPWIIVLSLIAGAVMAWLLFRRLATRRDLVKLRQLIRRPAGAVVRRSALAGMLFAAVAAGLLPRLLPITDSFQPGVLAQMAVSPGWTRLWFVLLAIVIAPVVEEALFRGVLFEGILRRYSSITAILATTALFALAHFTEIRGHWPGTVAILGGGCLLAIVRLQTGSLVPTVVAHAGYNAVVVVLAWLAMF